jgi:putative alpha-1,2-mannosidase
MKKTLSRRFRFVLPALLLLPVAGFGQQTAPKQPADYVNPLIGTAPSTTESARRHSEAGSELKGQTFPATGVPHGLTQWTPQTHATEQKCLSPYYYQETKIQAFAAAGG